MFSPIAAMTQIIASLTLVIGSQARKKSWVAWDVFGRMYWLKTKITAAATREPDRPLPISRAELGYCCRRLLAPLRRCGVDGRHLAHTFSMDGWPSRPSGLNTSSMIRIANTTVCDQRWPKPYGSPSLKAWMIPMTHASDDRAGEVADAAEHGGGERDEAELEAQVVPGRSHCLEVEQAGGAGHRATEGEREGDRPVDVDAHQHRGVLVLRGRAHRTPLPGALHEHGQPEQQRRGDEHDDDRGPVQDHVSDRDAAVRDGRGPLLLAGAVEHRAEPLEDEAHADRGDQRRELGSVPEPPVREALDQGVDQRAQRHDRRRATAPAAPSCARPARSRSSHCTTRYELKTVPSMNRSPWAKLISSMMPYTRV